MYRDRTLGAVEPELVEYDEVVSDRILTIPNVITIARLLCLPVFLWLLLHDENRAAGAWLLGALGATDFVDGYVARHFHQTSALGKVLDPVADRLAIAAGLIGEHKDAVYASAVTLMLFSSGLAYLFALGAMLPQIHRTGGSSQ